MAKLPDGGGTFAALSLRTTRALLVTPASRSVAGVGAFAYALLALGASGLLQVRGSPSNTASFLWIIPTGPGGWWNYPQIDAGGPYFLLALPVLSSILMVLVAVGVGIGMAAALVVAGRVLRNPRGRSPSSAAAPLAGLTPAVLAVLTLGACCSTTAAATAGIELTAKATGTSSSALLSHAWYLGLFQAAVVYFALVAQERIFAVYTLVVPDGPPSTSSASGSPAISTPRAWGELAVRGLLLTIGTVWTLSAFTAFFQPPAPARWAAVVISVLLQHLVPGITAIAVALFPLELRETLRARSGSPLASVVRAVVLAGGIALLTWIPSPWCSEGAPGLANVLLGFAGLPASVGAVGSTGLDPVGLVLRWGVEVAGLGAFSLATAIAPRRILALVARASTPEAGPGSAPLAPVAPEVPGLQRPGLRDDLP